MSYKLLKDLKAGDVLDVHLGEGITKEVKGNKRSRAKLYFYLADTGDICSTYDIGDDLCDWHCKTGNYFKTNEQAEEYKEILEIEAELRELADWDGEGDYYLMRFDSDSEQIESEQISSTYHYPDRCKFASSGSCRNAITKVGEERVKKYLLYRW